MNLWENVSTVSQISLKLVSNCLKDLNLVSNMSQTKMSQFGLKLRPF